MTARRAPAVLLVLAALLAMAHGAAHAGGGTVPRMFITDADGVQVDVRNVKVIEQTRVFGQTTVKRKTLKALVGKRGMGTLTVAIDNIREIAVKDSGYNGVTADLTLRDGQKLEFLVSLRQGDIRFEGTTPVGLYSISLKNVKDAVLQYDAAPR